MGGTGELPRWSCGGRAHDTHQDPNGNVCEAYAGSDNTLFAECIRHLGVADRRGFCMSVSPGICPGALSSYIDVCEAMNS